MKFMGKFSNYALSVSLLVAVGLIGWNLQKTTALSSNVDVVSQKVDANRDSRIDATNRNEDDHRKIIEMLATMMPRRETELRLAFIETKLKEVETKLAELQMQLQKGKP